MGALLANKPKILVASISSDGKDNGDIAGALCDTITRERSMLIDVDPSKYLAQNDSETFFQKIGDEILTGQTGSNVADLIIAIKE